MTEQAEKPPERVEIDLGWAKLSLPVDYDRKKLPALAEVIDAYRRAKLARLLGQRIEAGAKLEVEGETDHRAH